MGLRHKVCVYRTVMKTPPGIMVRALYLVFHLLISPCFGAILGKVHNISCNVPYITLFVLYAFVT